MKNHWVNMRSTISLSNYVLMRDGCIKETHNILHDIFFKKRERYAAEMCMNYEASCCLCHKLHWSSNDLHLARLCPAFSTWYDSCLKAIWQYDFEKYFKKAI